MSNLVTGSTNGINFGSTGNFFTNNRSSGNPIHCANTNGNGDGGGNAAFRMRRKKGVKIDHIETYSSPETGDIFLYTFSTKNPQTDQWVNVCEPDAKGRKMGFPLSGYWDDQGNHIRSEGHYSITCTSGTMGKCVLMGYLPWGKTKSGKSLWDYHQACVRLLRADYCGNGNPHTRTGTKVEVWDREGIQVDTSAPGLTFEAAWDEDGAVCVKKVRIPEDYTLEGIVQECPEKLQNAAGDEHCPESFGNPRVLILNRSAD